MVIAAPVEHARLLGEVRTALQDAGADEAAGVAQAPALEARLERVQAALDRIEARLAEVERDLALLIRPSWPF